VSTLVYFVINPKSCHKW